MTNPTPRPMKATLISSPQNPLGTLYYVWKQSRHNKPLPSPYEIEILLKWGSAASKGEQAYKEAGYQVHPSMYIYADMLGYPPTFQGAVDAARHIRDEIEMILHESIPVVENLHFVFHLENIPISLREQLVRHRIGTALDGRVGADIIPEPLRQGLMEMQVIPDLAESTWWSQTSRVIPNDTFYDEGRFIVPKSLEGKKVEDEPLVAMINAMEQVYGDDFNLMTLEQDESGAFDAVSYYMSTMKILQHRYKVMQAAGIHIEDCRQIIPVGVTHGITWTLNLKAILHIFGKRSSWISQIGIWGELMGDIARELRTKVHPAFGMVLMPQCIKKGKYVGCPVAGTNAERIAGVDGMPPCPLWVRYETESAIDAVKRTEQGDFPGREVAAWQPPRYATDNAIHNIGAPDIRNWDAESPVEKEMLDRTSDQYSGLWGFDVMEGVPDHV